MARTIREGEIIDLVRRTFPRAGIGDDTAVLDALRGDTLFASDAVVEGVHFLRELSTPAQAVQKAVTSNVSDIHAMGGTPIAIVCTAGIPPRAARRDVKGIVEGLEAACRRYVLRLAGGDTVLSPGGYFFDIAIVGSVPKGRAIRRAGARPGDALCLFGSIGSSAAGLAILSALGGLKMPPGLPAPSPEAVRMARGMRGRVRRFSLGGADRSGGSSAGDPRPRGAPPSKRSLGAAVAECLRHHLVPDAAPLASFLLRSRPPLVTAMIDVSDGLAKDLRTLCAESGVGAVVEESALPLWPPLGGIFPVGRRRLAEIALSSGEEYVLLAAVRPEAVRALSGRARTPRAAMRIGCGLVIGEIVREREGLALAGPRGAKRPFPRGGFEHSF